jgi:uncharacterized heparinase superfamily protein
VRLVGLFAGRIARLARRAATAPLRLFAGMTFHPAERLLIAPQDIRTGDPTTANDIYAGYFAFGGKIVNAHGRSPFEIEPGSPAWARALAGFGWLRHLRAADTARARDHARALVDDFLTHMGKPTPDPAWEPRVVARRTLAWLSQSPLILDGADRAFYRRFMKGLGRSQMVLEHEVKAGLSGEPRLLAAITLAELGLCAQAATKLQKKATRLLAEELDRQILPDGGHVSRNPQVLIDLLLDLLPLRQAYAARNIAAPPQLLNAIDRIMPMLRLFRHGDSALALFNGMGVTAPEMLATVLAYDDARAQAITNAPYSGYQRLEMQGSLLIVDAGPPPPQDFSEQAHAGCLAFEFSSEAQHLVINCGAPDIHREAARQAARMTAAHSTVVIDDTSSCRFAFHSSFGRWLGHRILSGPDRVTVERSTVSSAARLRLSHNGYQPRFGLIHERDLTLSNDGRTLEGQDRLRPSSPSKPLENYPYCLRFHIHPSVRLKPSADPCGILFELPSRAQWLFEAPGHDIRIAESVFFASPDGPRRCEQIVISSETGQRTEINWALRRLDKTTP